MLVLKLERWPQGDRKRAEVLGFLEIANDCTGTDDVGHYQVTLRLPKGDPFYATIRDFARAPSPRRAWQLVSEALRRVL